MQLTPQQALALHATIHITPTAATLTLESGEQHHEPFSPTSGIEEKKEAILASPLLTLPFKSTTLYLEDGSPYIIVPSALQLSPEIQEGWVQLALEHHPQLATLSCTLHEPPATLLWNTHQELFHFCLRTFPMARFEHPITTLIQEAITYSRLHHPRVLLVQVTNEWADLIYCQEGELELANRQSTLAVPDLLYHITALWRQFALQPEQDHLRLIATSYAPHSLAELEAELRKVIRNVIIEQ